MSNNIIEKTIINRFDRTEKNSVIDSETLQEYSVDSILTDEENRTLWINGTPFGNAYIHFDGTEVSKTQQPTHAEIFNDFENNIALGNYSHAEGYENKTEAQYSHVEGQKNIINSDPKDNAQASHAEGRENIINNAPNSHAEGKGNKIETSGREAHVEGYGNTATAQAAHAEGYETTAEGRASHTEGLGTISTNEAEHASGKYNVSNTGTIFSVGIGTSDDDRKNAIAIRKDNDTYKTYISTQTNIGTGELNSDNVQNTVLNIAGNVYIEGNLKTTGTHIIVNTETENTNELHVTGETQLDGTTKIGINEASPAELTVIGSTKFGVGTSADGSFSHAEGRATKTGDNAAYAHAEGSGTTANGVASHTEGYYTTASGDSSHAEGNNTNASGQASHAEGSETRAEGHYSHTEGLGTKTTNEAEHASGKYNVSNTGTIFSVGIGTSDDDRKNAFEITSDGDVYIGADDDDNNPCSYPGDGKTTLQSLILNQNLEEINYADLVSKRNNSGLIPGKFYRIVDYITTTTQENTASAGYQFDIIVLALSTNTLSEDAWAVQHDFDKTDEKGNDIAHNINMCLIEKYFNADGTPNELDLFNYDGVLPIQATYELNELYNVTLTNYYYFELTLNKILDNYKYNLTVKQNNIIYNGDIYLDTIINDVNYFVNYSNGYKLPFSIFKPTFFSQYFSNYTQVSLYVTDGYIPVFSIYCIKDGITYTDTAICYTCYSQMDIKLYLYLPLDTISTAKLIRYFIDHDPPPERPMSYPVNSTGVVYLINNETLADHYFPAKSFKINITKFFDKYPVLLNTGDNQNSMHTSNGNVCSYDYLKENYLSTHFENSKINAWKLCYCLDNDKDRFNWADDTTNGKGVIYRMIDAFGNECSYDFKNILFKNAVLYNYFTFNDYADGGSKLTSVDASVSAPSSTVNNKIINNTAGLSFNMFIKNAENTQFINNELNNCFKCNINANFENTKILYFNNQTITTDKSNTIMLNGNIEANNVS